jgi:glycosyltransferase involved in cell wall biosynthesis
VDGETFWFFHMIAKHISVCVCTYRRPEFLKRLLDHLAEQETAGAFTYSIVVVDNDSAQSARPVVDEFSARSGIPIRYCVEPRRNIALARNKAIENADGDFAALIDDDEFPEKKWLAALLSTCEGYGVDGVLGPVKRHFDQPPPRWLAKSHLYERPINPTGTIVRWPEARTGNALLRKKVLLNLGPPFRPQFRAGEDQDFFRRRIEQGHTFIWSADAVVYETVPPGRWRRRYMLRKALLRGASTWLQPTCGAASVAKSLVAVPLYLVVLPFALLAGHHHFVTLLVSMFDHLGKLLALVGINPIREQYVTE